MTWKLKPVIKYNPLFSCIISNGNLRHWTIEKRKKSLGEIQGKIYPAKLWKNFSLYLHKVREDNTFQSQTHGCSSQVFHKNDSWRSRGVSSGLPPERSVSESQTWQRAKGLCYMHKYVYKLLDIKKKKKKNQQKQNTICFLAGFFCSKAIHQWPQRQNKGSSLKTSKMDLLSPYFCSVPTCSVHFSPHWHDSSEVSGTLKR